MPCETLVCRRLFFAAPPYARREPLRKPVTISKQKEETNENVFDIMVTISDYFIKPLVKHRV